MNIVKNKSLDVALELTEDTNFDQLSFTHIDTVYRKGATLKRTYDGMIEGYQVLDTGDGTEEHPEKIGQQFGTVMWLGKN